MNTVEIRRTIFYLIASCLLCSCAYIQGVSKQNIYLQNQKTNPRLHNLKHIIDRNTFFIYGLILNDSDTQTDLSLSVAAYSNELIPHELVDVTHYASINTHFALNLPAGSYDLLVLADKDKNSVLEQSEVIGQRQVELKLNASNERVLTDFDIDLSGDSEVDWVVNIPVPQAPEIETSLVYPKGSIRRLDDPIFGRELSTLGMYEPAAFMERAPTMFYSLEEYLPYKTPVIFVHGIGGTVREFIPIVERMDREHYVPWFYYYPSGADLDQLAENFYRLYLSGNLFPKTAAPMIVVAHSMGGLVVREALNLQQGTKNENSISLLMTIATPFGGSPDAALGVKSAPMVLPSWRDLNPKGRFIQNLFRKPLPDSVHHQLLYAYANQDKLKSSENNDGVVTLSSQLHPVAQSQSSKSIGFNSSHTGILNNSTVINQIIDSIQSVKGFYPKPHIRAMQSGGYAVELGNRYSNNEKYAIKILGKYLFALSKGKLVAVTPFQRHFILMSQGKAKATHFAEKAWLKFVKDYPYLIKSQ